MTNWLRFRSEGVIESAQGTINGLGSSVTETVGTAWERFETLYRTSRDDLYAYAWSLLRDRAAAEDVTALTFENRTTTPSSRCGPRYALRSGRCPDATAS